MMLLRFAKVGLLVTGLCCVSFKPAYDDEFCGIKNSAFKADEVVTMKVYYSTMGAYIGAGEATFSTTLERYNGKPVYHCVGEGKTYSFFDNFLKCVTATKAISTRPISCLINSSATWMKVATKNTTT